MHTRLRQRTISRSKNDSHASCVERLHPVAQRFGISKLVPLDVPLHEASQLAYLDLLPKQAAHKGAGIHAVAEHQGSALLYLVDARGGARAMGPKSIHELQRLLANRSDSAWLGIVKPGELDLYPVRFSEEPPLMPSAKLREQAADAPLFFQSLVHGTFHHSSELPAGDHVYQQILKLLQHTTETYVPDGLLDGLEVLSMTGRALFFRFLHDRKIVEKGELEDICPSASAAGASLTDCFSTARRAAETSAWLDKTFNGDFLPLPLVPGDIPTEDRERRQKAYQAYYRDVERKAGTRFFRHLDAIMKGWHVAGPRDFQPELDWNDLQFAHIPVGVLSEVYEHFSHQVDPKLASEKSVHYTPRFIAQLMVRESFDSMPQEKRAKSRVLDPSCGAGIFLVLAFRKLFEAAWQASGQRPDKRVIQDILYQQIRGFDVSESALRLSALALYITAIELNATQRPPSELKMPRNLRGAVLHHFGPETALQVHGKGQLAEDEALLGSLGSLPDRDGLERFAAAFDLVIGNPPWTRLRDESPAQRRGDGAVAGRPKDSASKRANKAFTTIARRVLKKRHLEELAKDYTNPDKAPDIPFLWRAAEWAKPGATIAFAMHARLFLHTQGKKDVTWLSAQKAFTFTGIINGTDLRWTSVWPGVKAPFCLAFAKNERSKATHGFYFVTPTCEYDINNKGRFRIDYASVNPLRVNDLESSPWLLKTLTLGTWLDVEVMKRIQSAFCKSLEQRWEEWDGEDSERTGKGYDISAGHSDKPAPFLNELLDFKRSDKTRFEIEWAKLKKFETNHPNACPNFPRSTSLYAAPLVVIPKAPGDNPHSPKAFVADKKLAFSQSYYGYSCKGHPEQDALAAIIHVLAHSTLARYFVLMRSASLGSDFMMFLKADFDAIPFPEMKKLAAREKKTLLSLSARLIAGEGVMPKPNPKAKTKSKAQPAQQMSLGLPEQEPAPQLDHRRAEAFWAELNDFVFRLYGLKAEDIQVIEDTLYAAAPYRRAGEDAFAETEPAHRKTFCEELQKRLQPMFDVTGETIQVAEPPGLRQDSWDHSWRFVAAWVGPEAPRVPSGLIAAAMRDANDNGTSLVTIRTHGRGLLLGILDARRWWTRSRALLCARHIIQEKLSAFDPPTSPRRP